MRHRSPILVLALFTFLAAGISCKGASQWTFPLDGSVVDTFTFEAELKLGDPGLDPSAAGILLNGQVVPFTESGDGSLLVLITPGPPLQDENTLVAHVPKLNGKPNAVFATRFSYLPTGKARAFEITHTSDLLTGPLAHNRKGDFMIENDVARFVVQQANQRDLHSVGQYGGNLIDAELVENPGTDNFFEMQPSVNIETVINATSVVVLNDGQDGTAAIVESCGPDDLIDYINASSQVADFGVGLPSGVDDRNRPVEGCTQFILEPRQAGDPGNRLLMETTLTNNGGANIGLFPGDYLNGMGELEQYTRLDQFSRPTVDAGIGELLAIPGLSSFSYFGFGQAEGVSYGRVGLPSDDPTSNLFGREDSSFSTSGVSFVLANNSILQLLIPGTMPTRLRIPSGESRSFSRYFVMGGGSAGDVIDAELDLRGEAHGILRGCVTVGGAPAPGARVTAGPEAGGRIAEIASNWVTDASGCYEGGLSAGTQAVAAAREGAPYEGGGILPALHTVVMTDGATIVQDIALPATGRLRVVVEDPNQPGPDFAVPARITVVGFDPSPEPIITFNSLFTSTGGTFNDVTKDPLPFGLTAAKYTGADGIVEFDLEPGTYQVYVSRGTEYSRFDQAVVMAAGATQTVNAEITRVLETEGFISSDYHVHSINSPDSRISMKNRVEQFAGEGVENFISTDHDARTDPNPFIVQEGLEFWLKGTIGEEITTFDTGHFNGYPLGLDRERPSGGSTDWARPAPPGEDFPSLGAFIRSPAEIHAEVLNQVNSRGELVSRSPNVVVHVNHIGSHFAPLQIDTSQEPPRSFLGPGEPELFRLDPTVSNFFHAFPALELWNGSTNGDQEQFIDERIGIWMNLLNQGIITTYIADTDTHTFLNLRTAGARTWTASPTDEPKLIDPDDVGGAVLEGRATGGQGIYVQTKLRQADGEGKDASFLRWQPTTLDTDGDPEVILEIHVQAPIWAEFDTVEIYANAATFPVSFNGIDEMTGLDVPIEFDAVPTQTLVAGMDFPVPAPLVVDPGVPGAARRELHLDVPFSLTEDTWFVVVVRGTEGVSEPMFPIYPSSLQQGGNGTLADLLDGNLSEGGTKALGATNALYADVDGSPGFDAPGVRLAP